jgi:hypothetical protein
MVPQAIDLLFHEKVALFSLIRCLDLGYKLGT